MAVLGAVGGLLGITIKEPLKKFSKVRITDKSVEPAKVEDDISKSKRGSF